MMEFKHREAVYHQRCMEIMRESRDLASLAAAASRALNHPEVAGDATLTAMVRAYVSECEARLRVQGGGETVSPVAKSQLLRPFEQPANPTLVTREQAAAAYNRLRLRLEEHLSHYDENAAAEVMVSLWDLYERYPRWVERASVERCQEQVRRLTERRDQFRSQLETLITEARKAAQRGDEKTAGWFVRRLSAIQMLLPTILPRERFNEIAAEVRRYTRRHDQRETLSRLMERERAVAEEVKRIGAIVNRCQRISARAAEEPGLQEEAEQEWRRVVEELRAHHNDWLAELMLEIDTMIDDLHDPDGRIHAQADRFLKSVRQALAQLHAHVRAIQKERTEPRK